MIFRSMKWNWIQNYGFVWTEIFNGPFFIIFFPLALIKTIHNTGDLNSKESRLNESSSVLSRNFLFK